VKPWSRRSKLELALLNRLRAWYWHFEVERLALKHLYAAGTYPVEAKLKDLLCLTIIHIIQFFVEDDALLRTTPDTEGKNQGHQK
jgi:hypothetical protein